MATMLKTYSDHLSAPTVHVGLRDLFWKYGHPEFESHVDANSMDHHYAVNTDNGWRKFIIPSPYDWEDIMKGVEVNLMLIGPNAD